MVPFPFNQGSGGDNDLLMCGGPQLLPARLTISGEEDAVVNPVGYGAGSCGVRAQRNGELSERFGHSDDASRFAKRPGH